MEVVLLHKIELKIYFNDTVKYAEFIHFLKGDLKYYDENGIYIIVVLLGAFCRTPRGGMKYFIKLTLQGIKKTHMKKIILFSFRT